MLLRSSRLIVSLTISAHLVLVSPGSLRAEPRGGGPVGLRELTVLALQNDAGLIALRKNIPVEEARRRVARQWRDPELRLGVRKDDNLRMDETKTGSDADGRDRSSNLRVRFFVPKPWEMKALVNRAAQSVDLANYEVSAAERRVVLEVRERYEELQYLAKKLETNRGRIAIIERHVAKERELLDAGGAFTLDDLSFEDVKIPGLKLALDAAETELKAAQRELAARVGLADGSRIRLTDGLLRSSIELRETDLDYLTLMAFAHRGEIGVLRHERAIAEAELDVVKSKRIPWFSFIETEYAQDETGGELSDEAYGVRFGVILPLFSSIAREEKVVEARLAAYHASLESNQRRIAKEVAEAFRSVEEASSHLARTDAAVARFSRVLEARARTLDGSEDLAARERLRFETAIERHRFSGSRLAAERLFNQAVLRLERAVGADLDQVFRVEFNALSGAGGDGGAEVIRATPVTGSR